MNILFPHRPVALCCLLTLSVMVTVTGCTTTRSVSESTEKPTQTTIERARHAYQQKDYGQTLILLNALVQQGNAEAQYALGYMYYYGQGIERNNSQALHWITIASNNGCPKAKQALQIIRLELTEKELPERLGAADSCGDSVEEAH